MTSAEVCIGKTEVLPPMLQAPKKFITFQKKVFQGSKHIVAGHRLSNSISEHIGNNLDVSSPVAARLSSSQRVVNLGNLSNSSRDGSKEVGGTQLSLCSQTNATETTGQRDDSRQLNIDALVRRSGVCTNQAKLVNSFKGSAVVGPSQARMALQASLSKGFAPQIEQRNSSRNLLTQKPVFNKVAFKQPDAPLEEEARQEQPTETMHEGLRTEHAMKLKQSKPPADPSKNFIVQYKSKQVPSRPPTFTRLIDVSRTSVSERPVGKGLNKPLTSLKGLKDLLNGEETVVLGLNDFKKIASGQGFMHSGPLESFDRHVYQASPDKVSSTRSILVNRDRSSRDISRLNDSCSPKK